MPWCTVGYHGNDPKISLVFDPFPDFNPSTKWTSSWFLDSGSTRGLHHSHRSASPSLPGCAIGWSLTLTAKSNQEPNQNMRTAQNHLFQVKNRFANPVLWFRFLISGRICQLPLWLCSELSQDFFRQLGATSFQPSELAWNWNSTNCEALLRSSEIPFPPCQDS